MRRSLSEVSTYYQPYTPWIRCRSCWAPAENPEPWCAAAACQSAKVAYEAELAAFTARYPELPDRLAAILRGEFSVVVAKDRRSVTSEPTPDEITAANQPEEIRSRYLEVA